MTEENENKQFEFVIERYGMKRSIHITQTSTFYQQKQQNKRNHQKV